MVDASSPNARPAEKFMHKNRLQEYAQRSALPLPVYQTVSEGSPHSPQFRSTVIVNGVTFRSSQTFSNRKEAEQDVAKVAFEGISGKIKQELCPVISADTTFCKSILHEYAVKMNLEKPTYTCSLSQGLIPMFISSVSFAGKMYKGLLGRNKKEAQQLAARAVIESILGDCSLSVRISMSQIIKSKGKLYATINHINDSNISPLMHVSSESNIEKQSETSLVRGEEVQPDVTNERPLIINVVEHPPSQIFEACPAAIERIKPKEGGIYVVNSGSIGSGTSLSDQPQGGPEVAKISTNPVTLLDDSHLRFFGLLKNGSCECGSIYPPHEEASGPSTSPGVGPSGIQGTYSSMRRKHSKKGKGQCSRSKFKKPGARKRLAATDVQSRRIISRTWTS